ncbi:MAG: hypothetical protein LUC86_03655 [Prevotellaceae bacterium]|nr:hypothetical protein [Prevotellaceae bacterium]
MLAAIPNWLDVSLPENNIRDFMRDWDVARKATTAETEVLNLGAKYHYEAPSREDKVTVKDGLELDFTNTSSGLQSLIPLFVYLNYLDRLQYTLKEDKSVSKVYEQEKVASEEEKQMIYDSGVDVFFNNELFTGE